MGNIDMTVEMHEAFAFVEELKARSGQRQQCGLFNFKKFAHLLLGRAVDALIGDTAFPLRQMFVLGGERLKCPALEPVVLHVTNIAFCFAVVAWRAGFYGQQHCAVVFAK